MDVLGLKLMSCSPSSTAYFAILPKFSGLDKIFLIGTDIEKITRKWSKPDKHEHENGKSAQELGEVDINKKTENQAKMTKLSMEWKRLCKIKAKVQKCQSQSQYRRISSQTGAGTEEYY
ncbi:hypothetical protein Tco_0438560 [Tanacetum coccineum]